MSGAKQRHSSSLFGRDLRRRYCNRRLFLVFDYLKSTQRPAERVVTIHVQINGPTVIQVLQRQGPKSGHYLLHNVHELTEDLHMWESRNTGREISGYRMGHGMKRMRMVRQTFQKI
jgi:hypothetical protein